jgi:hypothetical protein
VRWITRSDHLPRFGGVFVGSSLSTLGVGGLLISGVRGM